MLKLVLPVSTALALVALPAAASAQCATVDAVIVPQIMVNPLDAGGATNLIQTFQLIFRRATVDTKPLTIRYQVIDDDSAAFSRVGLSQGPVIDWTSSDSARSIGALRSEAYALLRTGVATIKEDDSAVQRSVTLRLDDVRSDIPAGVYREQFSVRYWCETGETGIPYEAMGAVSVSVAVPNVLSASLAGTSLRGEIDFMDFATLTRAVQVSVRSTGPYRVTTRSANGSALVRQGAEGSTRESDRISYSASFAGEPIEVRADGVGRMMPRAGLAGRNVPLEVNLNSTSGKVAGLYADTLFVMLEPAN